MLTVAPLVAATTLQCWQTEGPLDLFGIVTIVVFGWVSIPLWPTYIPAVLVTPVLMHWLSARRVFRALPLPLLFVLSAFAGALAGVAVMATPIILALKRVSGHHQAFSWAVLGAVSGAVTFPWICLLYRLGVRRGTIPPTAPPVIAPERNVPLLPRV